MDLSFQIQFKWIVSRHVKQYTCSEHTVNHLGHDKTTQKSTIQRVLTAQSQRTRFHSFNHDKATVNSRLLVLALLHESDQFEVRIHSDLEISGSFFFYDELSSESSSPPNNPPPAAADDDFDSDSSSSSTTAAAPASSPPVAAPPPPPPPPPPPEPTTASLAVPE